MGKICFFPTRNYENNLFLQNFQNPGGPAFPTPDKEYPKV